MRHVNSSSREAFSFLNYLPYVIDQGEIIFMTKDADILKKYSVTDLLLREIHSQAPLKWEIDNLFHFLFLYRVDDKYFVRTSVHLS